MEILRTFSFFFIPLLFLITLSTCQKEVNPEKTKYYQGCRQEMILIRGGEMMIGNPEPAAFPEEKPVFKVQLSPYYLSKYEITIEEFSEFLTNTGYQTAVDHTASIWYYDYRKEEWIEQKVESWLQLMKNSLECIPAFGVSWIDAVAYCNWRSVKEGLEPCYEIHSSFIIWKKARNGYRLPTEMEWEAAAKEFRSEPKIYSGTDDPYQAGWFSRNASYQVHQTGTKMSNRFGLYDINGNLREWCWNSRQSYPIPVNELDETNYIKHLKALRGGAWFYDERYMRNDARFFIHSHYASVTTGFRICRNASPDSQTE